VRAHLPALFAGACDVTSISASSASNVWAAGEISPVNNGSLVMLHFNGKAWASVEYPVEDDMNVLSVATSGPSNAWATDGTDLFRWNGTVWSLDGTAPTNDEFEGMATDTPDVAYAAGFNSTTDVPVVMKFNGTAWSSMRMSRTVPHLAELTSVVTAGTSVWALGQSESPPYREVILHSDGGAWSLQFTAGKDDHLTAISAVSPASAYVAGDRYTPDVEGAESTYLLHFDGHSWAAVPSKL
jgi:hypothetical protein